jgi:hypothetical protein
MRIAAGEDAENFPADDGKGKAAQSLEPRAGRARAAKLSSREEAYRVSCG